MKLLDLYIARQYLFNVIVLLVLLFSFVVTVDVALNLDRFIARAGFMEHESGESWNAIRRVAVTGLLIADLWWPRLLQLFNFMNGLVLVGAMGFTFTQLVRHRELVAVLASGVSLFRIARPALLVALIMITAQVVNQELLIPRVAPRLTRDPGQAGVHDFQALPVNLTPDGRGRLFQARAFDPQTTTMSDVHIWVPDGSGRRATRLSAASATWDGSAWVFQAPAWHPLVLDTRGAEPMPVPDRLATDLDPTRLLVSQYESLRQSLSTGQLTEMRSSPAIDRDTRENLDRVRFGRFSILLSTLLSLVITMPFFLTREPKNMVLQSLKCAPIGIGAMLGGILGATAPIPGLPVWAAVFVPVLILIPVAIATVSMLRT